MNKIVHRFAVTIIFSLALTSTAFTQSSSPPITTPVDTPQTPASTPGSLPGVPQLGVAQPGVVTQPVATMASVTVGPNTEARFALSGDLEGSRAEVKVSSGESGMAKIKLDVHDIKRADIYGTNIVLWKVNADNSITKVDQAFNSGNINETSIKGEQTAANVVGFFLTSEETNTPMPTNAPLAVINYSTKAVLGVATDITIETNPAGGSVEVIEEPDYKRYLRNNVDKSQWSWRSVSTPARLLGLYHYRVTWSNGTEKEGDTYVVTSKITLP